MFFAEGLQSDIVLEESQVIDKEDLSPLVEGVFVVVRHSDEESSAVGEQGGAESLLVQSANELSLPVLDTSGHAFL